MRLSQYIFCEKKIRKGVIRIPSQRLLRGSTFLSVKKNEAAILNCIIHLQYELF